MYDHASSGLHDAATGATGAGAGAGAGVGAGAAGAGAGAGLVSHGVVEHSPNVSE